MGFKGKGECPVRVPESEERMKRRWREVLFGVTTAKHFAELAEMAGPVPGSRAGPTALKETSRGAVSRKPRPPSGLLEGSAGADEAPLEWRWRALGEHSF